MEQQSLRLITLGRLELVGGDASVEALNKRRRKLAVLAYLALAQRPVSRQALLEMFWGGQPEIRARHSLSDALSNLRRALGPSSIVTGTADVAIDRSHGLVVDALEMAAAVRRGDHFRAIELYQGPFLAGVMVEDSTSFEEWMARERERLRLLFARSCETWCDALAGRGDWEAAAALTARWVEAAPHSARAERFQARIQAILAEATITPHRAMLPPTPNASLAPRGSAAVPPTAPEESALAGFEASLLARWARARGGRRQLVVLADEGTQARALVRAIERRARAEGATVVGARAYPAEQHVAYGVLAEIVRAMLDAPGIAGTAPEVLAELGRLVPEVRERFRCPEPLVAAGDGARLRLFDALRPALESMAFEAPVLLRLEDLHLADPATHVAFHHALRSLRDAAVMVVATVSRRELTGDGAVARLIATLRELAPDDVEVFALAATPDEEVPSDEPPRAVALASAPHAPRPAPDATIASAAPPSNARRWRDRRVFIAAGVVAVVLLVASLTSGTRNPPVLAVGLVQDRTGGDTGATARVLPDLLATSLARIPELRVVSRARLYEGLTAIRPTPDSALALARAARAIGATELLEGALARRGTTLRLDVRQVDLASGTMRFATTVEGDDAFELAERVTSELARARRLPPPTRSLSTVTSTSLTARRMFDEGLRTFFGADAVRAHAFFEAALREDSTFALAAHYAAITADANRDDAIHRALRLADRASDRERLLIQAHWLLDHNEPRSAAVAETLAVRYPDEMSGGLIFGQALEARGDFTDAIAWFRRVMMRDSIGLAGTSPICYACSALGMIKSAAMFAGSFREAEDAARRLAGLYRDSRARAGAWLEVAQVLARAERFADAEAAIDSATRYDPSIDLEYARRQLLVRTGRFTEARVALDERLRNAGPYGRLQALGAIAAILRLQGRPGEALSVARQARALADSMSDRPVWFAALPVAVVEMDYHPRAAAALFDSMAVMPFTAMEFPARNARHRAWMLTHVATSLANAGDTARLPTLADSVRRIGARSGYARDQRLHHYVRGLLWEARGDTARALRDFLQARYSPTETYFGVRLARAQLALGRAADAAATATAALRGPLDSQNQYESRTELHEVLADALAAVGDRRGAAQHSEMVVRAWEHGDEKYVRRAARARERMAALACGCPARRSEPLTISAAPPSVRARHPG